MAEPEMTVTRDDANRRYTLRVDGELAGFSEIRPDDAGRLVMPHTVIVPSYRGRGLASVLVRGALEDAAARGEAVVPMCPVVHRYLENHTVDGLTIEWPSPHGAS